jgi:hypothetical protein
MIVISVSAAVPWPCAADRWHHCAVDPGFMIAKNAWRRVAIFHGPRRGEAPEHDAADTVVKSELA